MPDHVSATVRGGESNLGPVTGVVTGDHSVAAAWSIAVTTRAQPTVGRCKGIYITNRPAFYLSPTLPGGNCVTRGRGEAAGGQSPGAV